MSIEKFRELMGIKDGQYSNNKDLRKRVIDVAALGGRVATTLEFKNFKEDENGKFLIEIAQEDGSRFWTNRSFGFDEILGMNFV